MDSFYDVHSAREWLLKYTAQEIVPMTRYLWSIGKDDTDWLTLYAIEEYPEPHCWRLIKNVGDEKQEAVFNLHGIIVDKDLPPITVAPTNTKSCAFLRQQITLSGLNTSEFEYAVDKARNVYNKFRRFFPEKQLLPWPELKCTISEGRTLTLGNRYFTRRSEAPTLQPIPFEPYVDPNRILAGCVNARLFHSADNTVNYYRRYKGEDGELIHDIIPPQNFRIGDIVDTQFCFVVYRMRTGEHTLRLMLYSITLVDGKLSDEYDLKKMKAETQTTIQQKPLKRKTGYEVVAKSGDGRKAQLRQSGPENTDGGIPTKGIDDMTIEDTTG
ncbi:hypothetical protein BDN72DRAFT_902770 [Pluteus cervinus]|uniref:Uncharacterized protein n=1 Tax=Pluteus cervinus TaxID=181527 RepID=A0ACD3ACF5_9AGAR|nr:hypothetical protein BDN72DRAFT_902770 [Pluteus cervinus]